MHPSPDEGDDTTGMIRQSARAFLSQSGGVVRSRAVRFSELGFDRAVWKRMAQNGWIGLRVSEAQGGVGLGMGAMCALAGEMGAGLMPEPLIGSCLSAALLAAAPGGRQGLAALMAGEALVLTAWQEQVDGLAAPGSDDGERVFVASGFGADTLLVTQRGAEGLALLEVDARAVEFVMLRTQDGGHCCTVRGAPRFTGRVIAADIQPALDRALDEACLATAAYLQGVSDAAFAMTLDYLRTRRQFGVAIGSFQSLRHRAADLKMQIELSRASIAAAAGDIDAGTTPANRARAVSRAKARAGDVALRVTQASIQMHGAIGYTDEHDIGLYLRKAMTLANQFGSAGWHRRRYAVLGDPRAA